MRRIGKAIRRWWVGELVADTPAIYRRHWTARVARWITDYWLREYKFVLMFAAALVAAVFTILRFLWC